MQTITMIDLKADWGGTLRVNRPLAPWRRAMPENQGKANALIHWLSRRVRTDKVRHQGAGAGAGRSTQNA